MSRASVGAPFTMQNAAVANGNGVAMAVDGYSTLLVSVRSSVAMSGGTTVNFEASSDNSNWVALSGASLGASPAAVTTSTADGDFRFNVTGYRKVRARISAYSAGTTTITGHGTPSTGPADVAGTAASTATVTGNVAHDAVDSGNPVKVGGKAESTEPAAVADADRVDAFFDLAGRLIVRSKARTGTVTSVNDTASSTTLLALNETRLGASVVNESTAILYLKCGATASATSYTIALAPMGTVGTYYEVPFGYTGVIDGIWSSDASGAARITEWT